MPWVLWCRQSWHQSRRKGSPLSLAALSPRFVQIPRIWTFFYPGGSRDSTSNTILLDNTLGTIRVDICYILGINLDTFLPKKPCPEICPLFPKSGHPFLDTLHTQIHTVCPTPHPTYIHNSVIPVYPRNVHPSTTSLLPNQSWRDSPQKPAWFTNQSRHYNYQSRLQTKQPGHSGCPDSIKLPACIFHYIFLNYNHCYIRHSESYQQRHNMYHSWTHKTSFP